LVSVRQAAIVRLRAWSARRHGLDVLPMRINRRRIYILPTRFGLMLAALLVAMLIAALNYNSNLGLAFAFFMASLVLVAMHHCHRNLLGLAIDASLEVDAFAGADANFQFMLHNESAVERRDIEVRMAAPADAGAEPAEATRSIGGETYEQVAVAVAMSRRGVSRWNQFELRTTHPFGWFRAWTYAQAPLTAFVAPRPSGERPLPSAVAAAGPAARAELRGDEEFAGLRTYAPGMPLKHMAWKVLARGGEPAVRVYSDLGAQPEWLEWSALDGLDTETRLSQLCRWVLRCEAGHPRPYGLKIPGVEIAPGQGAPHRARCLRALAAHGASPP
jgi:uncharacterized protein (DUF58 family)